jgi:hypothetical protein
MRKTKTMFLRALLVALPVGPTGGPNTPPRLRLGPGVFGNTRPSQGDPSDTPRRNLT